MTIAYYEIGAGPPFVWMDLPYSQLQLEWSQDARGVSMFQAIAAQAQLVRYDHRGFGLSDRSPQDISLDAMVCDLETVVSKLELSSFVLFANRGPTTPIAVTYAARHPERVTQMVLFNASSRMPEKMWEQISGLLDATPGDWRFSSERPLAARARVGGS